VEKVPVDQAGETDHRVAEIDDLIERWLQQVPLTFVPRSGHRPLLMPNPGQKRITNHGKQESQIAGKASCYLRFLAIPITSPFLKSQSNQSAAYSSQSTEKPGAA